MSSYDLTEAIEAVVMETMCAACTGDLKCRGCHWDAERWIKAALPHLEQQIRDQIEGELRTEAQRARDAYLAAKTDHFAHDYCRWVGHAEALSSAAERIARTRKDT